MKLFELFFSAVLLSPQWTVAFIHSDGRWAFLSRDLYQSRVSSGARKRHEIFQSFMSVAHKDRIFASINNTHDEYYLDDHIDILPPKTAKTNKWERLILFYYQGHARRIRLRKTGDDITT